METVTKLMNKLGKLPKERLCMQNIGLSDIQLTTFLQHCVTFLDIFIDVSTYDKLLCISLVIVQKHNSCYVRQRYSKLEIMRRLNPKNCGIDIQADHNHLLC
jgi:hypothetical protein